MKFPNQNHNSQLLHAGIIALLCLICYSNTFHAPFVFDDEFNIIDNSIVRHIGNFLFSSTGYEHFSRRFIGYLTFSLNYSLGGSNVTGYHIVNLAIHIANSMLVYLFVLFTFRTPAMSPQSSVLSPMPSVLSPQSLVLSDSGLIAFFSAVLFAVHPIQTQAVTYIVQRLASLASFFYLLSLVTYIKSRTEGNKTRTEGRGLRTERRGLRAEDQGLRTEGGGQEAKDSGQGPVAGSREKRKYMPYFYYGISIVSAVLAMMTKEIAFTLPFIVVLYELVFFGRGNLLRRALWALPLLATVVIIPLSLLNVSQPLGKVLSDASKITVQTRTTPWQYLMTEFSVIVRYMRLLFFPAGQNVDYDYPIYRSFFYPQVIFSFMFLAALFGLGIYLVLWSEKKTRTEDRGLRTEWKGPKEEDPGLRTEGRGLSAKIEDQNSVLSAQSSVLDTQSSVLASQSLSLSPQSSALVSQSLALSPQSSVLASQSSALSPAFKLMGFGILWFFITLSVESSIIPIADVIFEHRVYLPSMGIFVCVVTGAFLLKENLRSPKAGRVIVTILALAAGVLSVATYMRNDMWRDEVKLWKEDALKFPAKERVHYTLGLAYRHHRMSDKAAEQFQLALKINPDSTEAHLGLGNSYQDLGMPDAALKEYLTAISLAPGHWKAHYNLGVLYDQALKMPDKAIKEFLTAINLKPDFIEAYNNLGAVYQALNMPDKAIKEFQTAINLKPDYPEAHYNLANVYKDQGMSGKATEHYLAAIQEKPNYVEAHNNLAILYQSLNMPDKAVNELQTVIRLQPDNETAHFNLGVLYYNMGQLENARRELIARLKIKPDDQIARQLLNAISR